MNKKIYQRLKELELASKDIVLFDNFQKIYPNHHMKDSYKKIIDRVTSATALQDQCIQVNFYHKDQELTSDKNIVKQTKNILEKLIKEKSYENLETIKYLKVKEYF